MHLEILRENLLAWWERSQRRFPWRTTRDPYKIFVAEVLLHRTRAAQVVDLFESVLTRYPSVTELAKAAPDELHLLLHSAGLRWRVKLLLEAATHITERFGGRIPKEREELKSIPGVGHYIAAAIRCFAFDERDAVVDTNVVRVLARVYGLTVTDNLRRSQSFHSLANRTIDPSAPRAFNLALLDLAALVCTPRLPHCSECPIRFECEFGRTNLPINPPLSVPHTDHPAP